jgi:hypothetical protein
MTIPPMMLPMSRPMMAHSASAPKTTASAPSTIAVICVLAPNHSVNCELRSSVALGIGHHLDGPFLDPRTRCVRHGCLLRVMRHSSEPPMPVRIET